MPPEPRPIDLDATPPETVVEFGSATEPRRRRWGAGGFGRGLVADRRVVPLAAALAAVAIFASLISEWQLTTVDRSVFGGEVGDRLIPTDVTDLGALGTGYLVGVFALVATTVLTMFGPPAGRHYARLIGLSAGATLLAQLIALATTLGDQSRIISRLYTLELEDDQLKLAYGRGLWCAFAGVLLALVALYLAGRHLTASPAAAPDVAPADRPAPDDDAAGWSWRRPAEATEVAPVDEPLDLTVGPAKPFTLPAEDALRDQNGRDQNGRDQNGNADGRSGRPGISG